MRVFLLRALLGWYMVPICYVLLYTVGSLLFGDQEEVKNMCSEFCGFIWNGVPPSRL